ncbi:MAG: outer membrane protein assembly factor BamA [Bacteroidota bacterium]|nr:outer membrane protein assembly factor BamA [Bacteroidota bacterium]
MKRLAIFLSIISFLSFPLAAQITTGGDIELIPGIEYEIGGVEIGGTEDLDKNVILLLSGLSVGDKVTIPGEKISDAIQNLWKQGLFEDIRIYVTQQQGDIIFLEIYHQELPKLSKFYFTGNKKSQKNDLREDLNLQRGTIVTENLIVTSRNRIRDFYIEKGHFDAKVEIKQIVDSAYNNAVILGFEIDPGPRIKIGEIVFKGNENLSDKTLLKSLKETKKHVWYNVFRSSKLLKEQYEEDKRLLIKKYNREGFRDARIIEDSVYRMSDDRIGIFVEIEEGNKFYFRDITFLGNSKYSTDVLRRILNINRGDVYDAAYLQERVNFDPKGNDIASLYLNNGYLFSNLVPVEVLVENDSIDIEIRIREGRQATIKTVKVTGNDRTNDHVIYRELRTRPGDLFSRSDIQRSIRELAQLGYFDQQQIGVNPVPDPETGTVDLEYTVVERSTSQLELQGGWGGNTIVGTLGLNFNNFSARNIFNGKSWTPLPSGDGQTISLRAQTNGRWFQSYSASFTEPWLGGRKPQSLTVSVYHNIQTNGLPKGNLSREELNTTGINAGIAKRLKWPDDYFTLYYGLEFRRFNLVNYTRFFGTDFLGYSDGTSKNINLKINLSRNNTDMPIFPTRGSIFTLSLEMTPPHSLMDGRDYSTLEPQQKYEWIEYYKWKFNADWFSELAKNLVFRAHAEFGFLNYYNEDYGLPPFERFYVGGDGLQNFVLDGREIVGLRGYPNGTITPPGGGSMYNKYIFELRYLISPNPNAQIFALAFAEAGNNFNQFAAYNPFDLKRSTGAGVRIFMPMFGLLGVDFGYGFDRIPGSVRVSGWQTHFIIGQQF